MVSLETQFPILSDANGSIGDLTAARNSHGRYVRQRVSPAQPSSRPKVNAQRALDRLNINWQNFPDSTRAAWNHYAARNPHRVRLGHVRCLTGSTQYIRHWLTRRYAGYSHPSNLPPPVDGPLPTLSINVKANATESRIALSIDPAPPWLPESGALLFIYYATQTAPPRTTPAVPYNYLETRALTFTSVIYVTVPDTFVAGNYVHVAFKAQRYSLQLSRRWRWGTTVLP